MLLNQVKKIKMISSNFIKRIAFFLALTLIPFFLGLYSFKEIIIPYTNKISPKAATPIFVYGSLESAYKKAKSLKLDLLVIEKRPHPIFEKGTIIAQYPSPHIAIKKGSKVKLVVSSGFKSISMPDYKGKSLDQLKEFLNKNKMKFLQVIYSFDKRIPAYQIAGTIPKPGNKIFPGQVIIAVVSLGCFPDVRTPVIIKRDKNSGGVQFINYLKALKKLKFVPFPMKIQVKFTEENDNARQGDVVMQLPPAGVSFFTQIGKTDLPTLTLFIKADQEYRADVRKTIEKYSYPYLRKKRKKHVITKSKAKKNKKNLKPAKP